MPEVLDSIPPGWIGAGAGVGFVLTVAIATHAIEKALGKISSQLDEIKALLEPISRQARE